jgi:integrase
MQVWLDIVQHIKTRGLIGATFLFTGERGAPLRPSNWRRRVWYDVLADSGIKDPPSPHSGRRTNATRLHDAGVSPFAVKKVLGHSISDVTARYIDVSVEDLRDAIRRGGELDA